MRGEVEIWSGDNLLVSEPNLIVDGAGVLLADIMSVSPSLSGIQDHATSSILDSSNYTIQAISFGTGADAFRANGHAYTPTKEAIIDSQQYPVVTIVTVPGILLTPFSYEPSAGFPIPPDPILDTLELNTSVSAVVGGVAVSSVFPGNGQLTNFMPSSYMSALCANTPFSSTLSAYHVASIMGCFGEGSSAPYTIKDGARQYRGEESGIVLTTTPTGGNIHASYFNQASSMDVSGFVNMIMSSVPDAGYAMKSPTRGLCVSAASDFFSTGIVEYSVTLSEWDIGQANAYGGIHHLGLWTIDMGKSLRNGNTPPFAFTPLNNPRKYRLFCRKGLSKNITSIQNYTINNGEYNYSDLTIKWRLHFV